MESLPVKDTIPYSQAFGHKKVPVTTKDIVRKQNSVTKSFFGIHTKNNQEVHIRNTFDNLQPFWFLTGSLIIIAVINVVYHKWFKSELTGFFRLKSGTIVNQEKESRRGIIIPVLYLIYYANISLFIWYFLMINNYSFFYYKSILNTFFLLTAAVILYSLLKKFLVAVLTVIFSEISRLSSVFYIDNQTVIITGSLLLPLNFIYIYAFPSAIMSFIILGIIGLLFAIRLVRIFINMRANTGFLTYQIILYLCSLEILPLVVLVKYLIFYGF